MGDAGSRAPGDGAKASTADRGRKADLHCGLPLGSAFSMGTSGPSQSLPSEQKGFSTERKTVRRPFRWEAANGAGVSVDV